MRQVLCIFRKDARHLWPQILAFVALAALAAVLDPTYTRRHLPATEQLIWTALPVACWNLVIAAVHAERLPGDRQYWLTRPFSRAGLVGAKALFVMAFVNLPVLSIQVGVLAALGIPAYLHWTTLLWRQAFFVAFLVLPAAALGAVTRNLKQVILAALMVAAPLFLVEIAHNVFRALSQLSLLLIQVWNGDLWIRTVYLALCASAVCGAALWLQYGRRATALARALLVGGVVLGVYVGSLPTAAMGIATQESLSANRIAPESFRIAPAPGGAVALLRSNGRRGWQVRLEIPARVDAPAQAAEFLSAGFSGTMQGVRLESGELAGSTAKPTLAVYLTLEDFDRIKAAPAKVQGFVDLTLFEPVESIPVPKTEPVALPGIGACAARPDVDGHLSVYCYSPFPRASLAIEFPGGGRHWIITRRTASLPLPTSAGFTTVERYVSPASFESWEELGRMKLVVERPVATIRRSFDFRDVRLPGYATR